MSGLAPELGMKIARTIGLRLDPVMRARMARLIETGARSAGVTTHDFARHLERDQTAMQGILDGLTIQESSFFRDPAQFEVLRRQIIPALTPPIVAWSAACANGQEPYSMAMCLADAARGEWRVVASDVSTAAVARAREARYSDREIAGVPADDRSRFLRRVGQGWEVAAELRDRVEVVHSNLITGAAPVSPASCHVIMCRNVLIYFERDTLLAVLERLARALSPQGHLFLGYSESLWQVSDRFRLTAVGGAFAYRLPQAGLAGEVESSPQRPRRASRRPLVTGAPTGGAVVTRQPRAAPRPAEFPDVVSLLARGEVAMAHDDAAGATTAFRQAVYLDPDNVIARVHLGFAFERSGDPAAALRSFTAARAALERADTAQVEAELEGYRPDELARLLDVRTGHRR